MSTAPNTSGPTSNKTRTLPTNKLRPGERAPNITVAFISFPFLVANHDDCASRCRTISVTDSLPFHLARERETANSMHHNQSPMQLSAGGGIRERQPTRNRIRACARPGRTPDRLRHAVTARQCTTEFYCLGDQMVSRPVGTLEDRPSNCRRG